MCVLFDATVVFPLIPLSLKGPKPLISVSKTATICTLGTLRLLFFIKVTEPYSIYFMFIPPSFKIKIGNSFVALNVQEIALCARCIQTHRILVAPRSRPWCYSMD